MKHKKNSKNTVFNILMGAFWLLLIISFGAGNLHPVAFFFNRQINNVSLEELGSGERKLPLTRWISTSGDVDEADMWEHCHKISSRVLGDYHTYLLYVIKDGDNFLLVRRHVDAQMTDSACEGGSSFRKIENTTKTDADHVQVLDRADGDRHDVAVPAKATVKGMLRYRLILRLPQEITDKYNIGKFTPVLEYGEETSTLSVGIFYLAMLLFVITIIYQSKFGTEDFLDVKLQLKDPDKVFDPGDTLSFKAIITPDKAGLAITNVFARLQAEKEDSLSSKKPFEEELQLAGMAVTQKGKKIVHTGEFIMPKEHDNLYASLSKKKTEIEWKIILYVEIKDYMTREIEKIIKT